MNEKEKIWFDDFNGIVLLHFVFGFCAGRRREKQISGGHVWAEVNGRVYDPDWAKVTGKIKLYGGMNYNVTGPGIPRYKGNRLYVKKI